MGGWRIAIDDCPKANRSGNCANCELVKIGGEAWFNQYKIRELRPPRPIQTERTDTGYVPLRKPLRPLQVTNRHCALGEFIRVGHTTFAAPVLEWQAYRNLDQADGGVVSLRSDCGREANSRERRRHY
jgi:hypothetical protein